MILKNRALQFFAIAMGWLPSISKAEVADKLPSIQSILMFSVLIGGGLFLVARIRWKIGILLFPIPLVIISDNLSLWREIAMRDAILKEESWVYFGVLGIQCILLLLGSISGIVFGYLKGRKADSGL